MLTLFLCYLDRNKVKQIGSIFFAVDPLKPPQEPLKVHVNYFYTNNWSTNDKKSNTSTAFNSKSIQKQQQYNISMYFGWVGIPFLLSELREFCNVLLFHAPSERSMTLSESAASVKR